jgi:hypothetical protein
MKKVYAIQDNDGHWYVIPFERKNEFLIDLENGEKDEYEYFSEQYDQYMTGGDLNNTELYADIL